MPLLAYLSSRNQYAPVMQQRYYRPAGPKGQAWECADCNASVKAGRARVCDGFQFSTFCLRHSIPSFHNTIPELSAPSLSSAGKGASWDRAFVRQTPAPKVRSRWLPAAGRCEFSQHYRCSGSGSLPLAEILRFCLSFCSGTQSLQPDCCDKVTTPRREPAIQESADKS
jgi:hypothetical protein